MSRWVFFGASLVGAIGAYIFTARNEAGPAACCGILGGYFAALSRDVG